MSTPAKRVVAVAGAGGPAGRAAVAALSRTGAVVAAADSDEARLALALAGIEQTGPDASGTASGAGEVAPYVVDLLDASAARRWVQQIETDHGRLDGMVHLVGGWRGGKGLSDTALDDWNTLERLLIRTLQHTSLAAQEALIRSGRGRFVIVSAAAAQQPTAGNAAYAAAKAAAEAWTLALADSFAQVAPSGELPAAATILVVKALVDDAMRAAKPEAKFAGFTDVADLAQVIAGLWDRPPGELNGRRVPLTD